MSQSSPRMVDMGTGDIVPSYMSISSTSSSSPFLCTYGVLLIVLLFLLQCLNIILYLISRRRPQLQLYSPLRQRLLHVFHPSRLLPLSFPQPLQPLCNNSLCISLSLAFAFHTTMALSRASQYTTSTGPPEANLSST